MKTYYVQPYDHLGNPLPLREVKAASIKAAKAQVEDLYGKIFGGGKPLKMEVVKQG